MRYLAFALAVFAGVGELAGAIMGLGMAGVGFAFGGGGVIETSMAVGLAIAFAIGSIFGGVAIMLLRDPRPAGVFVGGCGLAAGFAGGPWAAVGAVIGLAAAVLAFRADRESLGV